MSEKYKFAYVRQPKSASSTILRMLFSEICEGKAPCDKNLMKKVWVREVPAKTWAEFFVFTVVRNPWTRAASSFTFMHKFFLHVKPAISSEPPRKRCAVPFLEYSQNAYALVSACYTHQCCAYIRHSKQWEPNFVAMHIGDQSHGVFTSGGDSMVDYIGRTEHLDEDWAEIIAHINKRQGTSLLGAEIRSVNGKAKTASTHDTGCKPEDYSSLYNLTTMHNIAKFYATDVLRFGFVVPSQAV